MEIKSISVKKLYTYGNYENVSFGYTADIEDGEDPELAKTELLKKIDEDFKSMKMEQAIETELAYRSDQLDYEISRKERESKEIQARIDKMLAFLKSHGVDTGSYELPF